MAAMLSVSEPHGGHGPPYKRTLTQMAGGMDWEPIAESRLWDLISAACERMDPPQRRLWEAVRIDPEKWQRPGYGTAGAEFWAVGLLGRTVVWYDDLEYGFSVSPYIRHGTIGPSSGMEEKLEAALLRLRYQIQGPA